MGASGTRLLNQLGGRGGTRLRVGRGRVPEQRRWRARPMQMRAWPMGIQVHVLACDQESPTTIQIRRQDGVGEASWRGQNFSVARVGNFGRGQKTGHGCGPGWRAVMA